MTKSVIIDGVQYVPIADSSPNAEQIARALMEQFWGELPADKDWIAEANELFVQIDEVSQGGVSVMDMTIRIVARCGSSAQ